MKADSSEDVVERYCPPELSNLVSFQIRLAQLAVSRVFNEYMQETGLSHVQYSSLRIIAANDGITQKDLALASGTPQTVMVGCLSQLEKMGLIARNRSETDRRHYHIDLTRAGEKLLKRYGDTSSKAHAALVDGLSKSEIKVLMKALKHIAQKNRD